MRPLLAWIDDLTVRGRLGIVGLFTVIVLGLAFGVGGGLGLLLAVHGGAGALAGGWLVLYADRPARARRVVPEPVTAPHGVADLLEAG